MSFKWLVSLASWLDKRFPPKVVVTQADYDGLQERLHRQSKDLARISGEFLVERARVEGLEKSLSALKEGIIKGQIEINPLERANLRRAFIDGDWGRAGAAGMAAVEGS